jgi:hypothetical protein
MTQVAGLGTTWNLPNYAGELFTADATQTPFLSMIGGLTGGRQTENFQFPTSVLYDFPAPSQPAISEQASVTAPAASEIARSQETNVTQIFQETVELTYSKESNRGRMSGLNTAGQQANPQDEWAWQIQQKLIKIARDIEYTFLQGQYQVATDAATANKTRGMLELITGNVVDNTASPTALTKSMIDTLLKEMADNGAYFNNMVIFVNSGLKQALTGIYGGLHGFSLPNTRNVGGLNIQEIETDFCKAGIVWDRFMPQDTLLISDMSYVAPVFQPVPGKGNFFEEMLAKTGASDKAQIYGQIGLAHGPEFLHGKITGLTV